MPRMRIWQGTQDIHFQNGIAERGIKELTQIARTILLHAQRHWPEYISSMLWPFALKTACERLNELSINENGETPISRLAGAAGLIVKQIYHTFGCPVFILDAGLQSGALDHRSGIQEVVSEFMLVIHPFMQDL